MVNAVILDVDGTLVDTNYQHAIAWDRAFARHEVFVPLWWIHRHIGMGGDKLVPQLAGDDVEERSGDDITGGLSQAELREAGATSVYQSVVELMDDLDTVLSR